MYYLFSVKTAILNDNRQGICRPRYRKIIFIYQSEVSEREQKDERVGQCQTRVQK